MTDSSNRAGQYVAQPGGYRAFIPMPLPPQPPVEIDAATLELLSRADRALGRLDGASEILPNPDLFVAMYVRKEAVLSSQIEGTQASLADVLASEAEAGAGTDVADVVNHVAAQNEGLSRLEQIPVSLRLMRDIHRRLMQDVRGGDLSPGEFRSTQNWLGPPGCPLRNAAFVPPPPGELMNHLGDLETFIHNPDPMPVLIKVGLVHGQFETIHPFLDGNGRMGRLLITFLLCERDVLKRPLLYLSHYFKSNRMEYYDRLQAIRNHGDWEGWLKFFLEGVFRVSQEATDTARKIVQLRETHRHQIVSSLGRITSKALELHEHLFAHPVITVHQAADVTALAYSNANKLIQRLVSIGLLSETTGARRNRRFRYGPYLELFED